MTKSNLGNSRPIRSVTSRLLSCLFAAIGLAAGACTPGKKEIADTDRKAVLHSIAHNVIVPAFSAFSARTDSLLTATAAFTSNPTPGALDAARENWRSAAIAWKMASAYSFGPVDDQFLAGPIDYPSVHYGNIEKNIRSGAVIDEAYLNTVGTSLKGLKAIEYLLFKEKNPETVAAEFGAVQSRRAYLLALAYSLNLQAKNIVAAWDIYADTFANSNGHDIKSATSTLVNKCVSQINFIKDERLAMPLGMKRNGTVNPDLIEGRLSGESVALLKAEVLSVKACFGSGQVIGINQLLDRLGATYNDRPLSVAIDEQFKEIEERIDAISIPLDQALSSEKPQVSAVYDAVKKLQILIEVDVVNQMGIILTFSDNDGD